MKVAILSGSVYGTAEEVARRAVELLNAAGFSAWHKAGASLAEVQAFDPEALLAVTSTTGMGELPDNLVPLYSEIRDVLPGAWRGLPGAVIGLAGLLALEIKLGIMVYKAVVFSGQSKSDAQQTFESEGMPPWAARLMAFEASLWRKAWLLVQRIFRRGSQ